MKITRHADAEWKGGLKDGAGQVQLGSGAFTGPYGFKSRFESGPGTNPEELIAAAHAGCYSMALTHALEGAGHQPERVHTVAVVHLNQTATGFEIPEIELTTQAVVPGLDDAAFQRIAEDAKTNCPVSKVLAGARIGLKATLNS